MRMKLDLGIPQLDLGIPQLDLGIPQLDLGIQQLDQGIPLSIKEYLLVKKEFRSWYTTHHS